MRRWLLCAAALTASGCFQLGANTLYRCESDGGCVRPDHACASDGFCHPSSDFFPDAGAGGGGGDAGGGDAGGGDAGGGGGDGIGDGGTDAGTVLPDGGMRCSSFDDCPALLTCGGAGVDGECAPDTTFCNVDGWCWELPTPQGNALWHIASAGPTDLWAVGSAGTILRWNGAVWHRVRSGTSRDLFGVWASAADDVWVVGDGDTLLHYDGSTLAAQASPAAGTDWRTVWGAAPGELWLGGSSCALFHRVAGSWVDVSDPSCVGEVRAISGMDSGIVASGGRTPNNKWCWVAAFDGATWSEKIGYDGDEAYDVLALPSGSIIVAAGDDGIFEDNSTVGVAPTYALASTGADVFGFGGGGLIQQRVALSGWTTVQNYSGSRNGLFGATALDGGGLYFVGERGYLGTIAGMAGVQDKWQGAMSTAGFSSVFALDPSNVYAVYGLGGLAARTGAGWTWSDNAFQFAPAAVWAGTPGTVWASCAQDNCIEVTDGGSNSVRGLNTSRTALWGFDDQDLVLGGSSVGIYQGTGNIKNLTSNLSQVTAICGAGDVAYAVSYAQGTGRLTSDAGFVIDTAQPAPLRGCHVLDAWHVYAVGNLGTSQVFTDAGWQSTSIPSMVDLHGVFARSPSDVYAVGLGGVILHGDGFTLQSVDSSTHNDLLAIHGLLDGGMWAVGEPNTILRHR